MPHSIRILVLSFSILLVACQPKLEHSGLYPIYDPPVCVEYLDSQVRETSGLIWEQGQLWTNNDSGDEPILYELDPKNGEVLRRVRIAGAENQDWEELAADSAFVYVGDMGNNNGSRENLRIFKLDKAQLSAAADGETIPSLGSIRFSYPEQSDFSASNSHNFDCEGFLATGGKLWLFSKNRGDYQTTLYSLPTDTGQFVAEPVGTFDVKGTITGADYHAESHTLALTGYDWDAEPLAFLWLFPELEDLTQFGRPAMIAHRIDFLPILQLEAITFRDEKRLFLSCEQYGTPEARLFCVEINELQTLLSQ